MKTAGFEARFSLKQALLSLLIILAAATTVAFEAAPLTMRVDYYHTGDISHETFSLDQAVLEPYGSKIAA